MSKLHATTGLVVFICFLGTGVHMHFVLPTTYQHHDVERMMYRANHIYLLTPATLNLLFSLTEQRLTIPIARFSGFLGSLLLLCSAPVFISAFWLEPQTGSFDRPLTLISVLVTLASVSLIYFAACAQRFASQQNPKPSL